MPVFREGRLDRLYLQDQSSLMTVPNAAGASTLAVANYARAISASLNAKVSTLVRADLTGARTGTPGSKSIETAEWSIDATLACGATGGALPPHGPILRSIFGATPTAVAGSGAVTGATNASPIVITQVGHGKANGDAVFISGVGGNTAANGAWVIANITANTYELRGSAGNGAYTAGGTASFVARRYDFSSSVASFVMASFNAQTLLKQWLGYGLFPTTAKFEFGGVRHAKFTASGEGVRVLDSDTFSGLTLAEAGQLTAFPAEPTGTLPTDSGPVTAHFGSLLIGSQSLPCIASASLDISTGLSFGNPPCLGESTFNRLGGDERTVGLSLQIIDSDIQAAKDLYAASKSKAQIDVIMGMGNTNPGTLLALARNCQFEHTGADDDPREVKRSFTGRAYGPTNNNDELTVWIF